MHSHYLNTLAKTKFVQSVQTVKSKNKSRSLSRFNLPFEIYEDDLNPSGLQCVNDPITELQAQATFDIGSIALMTESIRCSRCNTLNPIISGHEIHSVEEGVSIFYECSNSECGRKWRDRLISPRPSPSGPSPSDTGPVFDYERDMKENRDPETGDYLPQDGDLPIFVVPRSPLTDISHLYLLQSPDRNAMRT